MQYFAATPSAAGWARRHTADVVARWGIPDLIDDCCLVVSELVGNAIRHAASDDGTPVVCRLVLKLFVDAVSVELWDPSSGGDVRPRVADVLSESGRGLAIVEALCGAPPLVFTVPDAGKTVLAVIPRRAA